MTKKPPYKVPTMAEINELPKNGYKVVSTFSGAGGSCTGYRMAGYDVVLANEFVPIAQENYLANASPNSYLDRRDIKQVKAQDILSVTGLNVGELDLFDGSPPCQAFSTAGKREKGWGKLKTYEHGAKQKNEDLFFEYIRLLNGLQPKVFVAENVSGLVKGTAKGYFLDILAGLKGCGYRVKAKLLDAQWLGVPQARQRIIFIGVRNDLGIEPVFPLPLNYNYTVRDAIPYIINCRVSKHGFTRGDELHPDKVAPSVTASGASTYSGHKIEVETDISRYAIGAEWDKLKQGQTSSKYFNLVKPDIEKPCPTVTAQVCHPTEKRKFTISELKRICSFPDDFVLKGSYAQQWERLGNSVPPVMMYHIAKTIRDEILQGVGE